jgi:tetraacyldisaccharide 4'-kinase
MTTRGDTTGGATYKAGRDLIYGEAKGPLAALLFVPLYLASLLYRLAVGVRNRLFDFGLLRAARLPAKVICVGNLTVGGTGKTPWIVFLANRLRARGHRVAVVSRGYKAGRKGGVAVVSDGTRILLSPDEAGDEPTLIARRCPGVPVLLGARRADAGRVAIERFGADVVLLDDGFQHRRLARDVDLVSFHARVGTGSGRCLPAGILREPLSSLGRASALILHGDGPRAAALAAAFRRDYPDKPLFRSRLATGSLVGVRTGERRAPDALRGRKVVAFAGIAVPDALFDEVRRLSATLTAVRPLPDHHRYDADQVARLLALARQEGADYTVTSEKDATKIDPRWIADPGELFYLEGDLAIEGGEDAALDRIVEELR